MYKGIQKHYMLFFSSLLSATAIYGALVQDPSSWKINVSYDIEQKEVVVSAEAPEKGEVGSICILLVMFPFGKGTKGYSVSVGRVFDDGIDFSNPIIKNDEKKSIAKLMKHIIKKCEEAVKKECNKLQGLLNKNINPAKQ